MPNHIKQYSKTRDESLININLSHLDRLYHEVVTPNGATVGVIDIYLDAPDYTLVFDKAEGFTCLDDIARAAVLLCRYSKQKSYPHLFQKIESLLSTIFYLQENNGYFYNFIFTDLSINKTHINSTATPNFWSWRAMWALSEIQLLNSPKLKHLESSINSALDLLIDNILTLIEGKNKLVNYNGIKIPEFVGNIGADQIAVIITSLTNCYTFSPNDKISSLIEKLGSALIKTQVGNTTKFPYYAFLSWKNSWHAWGNCQSCALLYSGKIIGNESFFKAAMNELQYFVPYIINTGFISKFELKQVGGEIECFGKKQYPQISYDIRAMVFAAIYAYDITDEIFYAQLAANLTMWLFGGNVANSFMYDSNTGRCYDGIDSPTSINKNCGAESTIEALLILNEIEKYPTIKQIIAKQISAIAQ